MEIKKSTSIVTKFLIVAVIALLYVGTVWFYRRSNQNEVASTSETIIPTQSENESSNVYKNGVYNAIGMYTSPGGPEQIKVQLTLSNDVITAAEVTGGSEVPASEFFQNDFIANYKAQVIGKSIADLQLTKVSGSSLTPKGFNDAVNKIKTQAQL